MTYPKIPDSPEIATRPLVRMRSIREQWKDVEALSRACEQAPDLPSRIRALCEYQGALTLFFRRHRTFLSEAIYRAPRGP